MSTKTPSACGFSGFGFQVETNSGPNAVFFDSVSVCAQRMAGKSMFNTGIQDYGRMLARVSAKRLAAEKALLSGKGRETRLTIFTCSCLSEG